MSVLIINCSARKEQSVSRAIASYLVQQIDVPFQHCDLGESLLPPMIGDDLIDLHSARHLDRESLNHHHEIARRFITQLFSSEILIIATPIYNFSVPVVLRQWIDYVLQPGETFQYSPNGPIGLTRVNRAYIITSSGGTEVGGARDFASPYLEWVCNFIGIDNVSHINAGGSKRNREQIIEHAKEQIHALLNP